MKIGIPREIKRLENRVALIPDGVRLLRDAGHEVYIERGAGLGAGFKDEDYTGKGAIIAGSHKEVFEVSDMVYKVKEPLPEEYGLLKEGQILYAFLHLAAAGELTRVLLEKKVTSVAFETVQFDNGHLPLLEPMSEVAGRLSVQEGAKYLESTYGGRGLLLGGVPGVSRAEVMILGAGTVGYNAAKIAYGMGARVSILDIDKERLKFIDDKFESGVETLYAAPYNIERCLKKADLLIAAVLVPGRSAPKLIKKEHVSLMKKGAVIVDVAIDQGGCLETSRPTYHDNPVFIFNGVVHYCVTNMPGAVPLTSTVALAEATLPYALKIANKGLGAAVAEDRALLRGINTYRGEITHPGVAQSLGLPLRTISPGDID